jgi:hypothetical protein
VVVLITNTDGADACEPQRHRQRQLDAREDLGAAHAHPSRGVDQLALDAVHGEVGVGDHRRHRQDHERDLDDREAEAEERVADREHDQARQRAADVAEIDDEERAATDVAEPRAQRDRDQQRDPDADRPHLERLQR